MAGKILTPLANGSFNTEFTLLLQQIKEEWPDPIITTAFYSRPITNKLLPLQIPNNYFSLGENTSRRSQNILTYNSTGTSTIITHNSTQLPTNNPNYPDNPNYPKIPMLPHEYSITHEYQFTYEYYSLLKTNTHYSRIRPITLKLLIISEIRTFT